MVQGSIFVTIMQSILSHRADCYTYTARGYPTLSKFNAVRSAGCLISEPFGIVLSTKSPYGARLDALHASSAEIVLLHGIWWEICGRDD